MKKLLQTLALLGANAVPAAGWFVEGWSAGTTLVIYWAGNIFTCLFVAAHIVLHRRLHPCRGHFKYQGRKGAKRGPEAPFLGGYLMISLIFSAAHGFFLAVMLLVLTHNGQGALVDVNWRNAGLGCANVLLFLTIDFAASLPGLRHRTFFWIEQMADRNLSRVIIIHLTLVLGMFVVAMTGAAKAFFGVFVGLKTLNDLATVLPQWEPDRPPAWLSRAMNRVPNAHPGKTFEEFWVEDKADEIARRAANERPWTAG